MDRPTSASGSATSCCSAGTAWSLPRRPSRRADSYRSASRNNWSISPNQRVVARRDASVKSGPAGTSSGLFGFLLREVIVSLLHEYTVSASATAEPTLNKFLLIM